MTLKHVLKYFSKTNSEDLGAKGSFAVAQGDEESVIQRAESEESHDKEVLRFAQDDGRFSSEECKELPSPVAFATQSPKCRKTRHFDKMLKLRMTTFRALRAPLSTYSLIYLFTFHHLIFLQKIKNLKQKRPNRLRLSLF